LIKHFTRKDIYNVKTKIGSVEVTSDHSLITLRDDKISYVKPTEVDSIASPIKYSFGNSNPRINLLSNPQILPSFKITEDKKHIQIVKSSIKIPIKFDLNKNFLAFFGLWIADGSYQSKGTEGVRISAYDDEECKMIINEVFKLFGSNIFVVDDGITGCVTSKTLFSLMNFLGFQGNSKTKRVPSWAFDVNEKLMAAFLSGSL